MKAKQKQFQHIEHIERKHLEKGKPWLKFFIFFILLFVIDRTTKFLVMKYDNICYKIFCIQVEKNYGFWLGIFAGFSFKHLIFIFTFIVFAILCLALLYFAKSTRFRIGIVLITAAILGNFFDRMFFGYVIDWITIKGLFSFNLADVFLVLAFLFIGLDIIKFRSRKKLKKMK